MKALAVSGSGREFVRRRSYAKEFKRQVVKETLGAGCSVSAVALRHRINTNLLFTWRRKYLRELAGAPASKLLPVKIEGIHLADDHGTPEPPVALPSAHHSLKDCIEIEAFGVCIRLRGKVDAQGLRTVLDVLSQR
jgi:transposase-like protein